MPHQEEPIKPEDEQGVDQESQVFTEQAPEVIPEAVGEQAMGGAMAEEVSSDGEQPAEGAVQLPQVEQIDYEPAADTAVEDAFAESAPEEVVADEIAAEAEEVDPRGANRVDDVDKAHDMAIAGDEFRTKAAENRMLEKEHFEKSENVKKELIDLDSSKPSVLRPIARKKHEARTQEARVKHGDVHDENNKERWAARATDEQMSRLGPEAENAGKYSWPKQRAETFDNRADDLERWAGILHNNPMKVSVAEGLEADVTPQMMLKLEDEAKEADKRLAELQEADWMKSHEEMDLGKASGVSVEDLEELMTSADDERREEIAALVADLNRTDLELRAKLAQLREEAIIEPLITENAIRNKSLADIKASANAPEQAEAESEQPEEPQEEAVN